MTEGQPLRILHAVRPPVGGIFRHILDLANGQADRGHHVGIVADSLTGGERADKALAALHALYAQGEPPEALLGRDIAPHYRRLMVARELSLATRQERARVDVSELGLNPNTVARWSDQAARFEREELEAGLQILLELDRHIKLG